MSTIGDAVVAVYCRECKYEELFALTALAGHEVYDMRHVRSRLTREGWEIDESDNALCPECVHDRDEPEEAE